MAPPAVLVADELSLGLAPGVLDDVYAGLAEIRRAGTALLVVEQRLATNPRYQIQPPAVAIRIAELAGIAGKKALQRTLLGQSPKGESNER